MKFKVRQALKKLQAIILVAAMVITLLPAVNLQQAEAGIASGAKTINYGAKVFTNPDLNESFDESEPGRWGMLYFANQKWRVLNVNENSLFILLNAAATGDVVFGETPGWTTSPVRTWLNGDYYTDSFTNAEKALIMDTSIEGASDKLFALSYDEANNASYGFDRDRARLIRGAYQYGWWLRTAGDLAGAQRAVEGLGKLVEYPSTSAKAAVRPACNLNISNIFMTSTISGGKSAATVGGGFVPVSDVTDKATEWKMTLIDNSKPSITINRVTRGNPTDSSRINDVKIEYSCTDPNTADNKYVSAVITDANDNIISYAKLGAYTPGEGTVDFNVDSEFDENGYKLVLFTEEASDGTLTDIASTPVNASVPPKVVERVLVDPEYTSVDAGQSVSYTAKVVGAGADAEGNGGYLPLQEVDWAIENNNSAATNWEWDVDDDHPNRIKVNIAANETSDEIRVIAISAEDPSVEGVGLINPFMVLKYDLEGGTYNGSTVIADVTNLTSQTIIGGTQAATAAVILPDPENGDLKKDNATFRGWFTEIGGEGDEFSNSNPKNLPQSMTLHAAWSTNMGKGDFLVSKIEDQVYTGRAIKPVVRVMHGQTELKQGVDYNVSYTNNTKVAKQTDGNPPTITVIGRGNYRESEVVKFSIVAKDINSSDISMTIQDKKYNKGNPVSSDPVIKMGKKSLAKDRDYKVIYDKIGGSSTASTKVPVTIQGIGNFTGTINTQFYIVPESKMMSAKGIKIEVPKTEYTGSAVEPTVVVKDGSQTVDPSEYTLTFNNNVKVGKGSVTVTGNGITYAGSKTVNFDITPKTLGDGTIPAATIKISGIPEQQFSADKVYPFETEDEFTVYDEAGKQFLTKNVDYTIEYKGNDKLGKATATLKGKGNYTGSFVKEFTIVACEMINDNLSYQISSAAYNNGAAVTPKIKIMDGSKVLKINKDYTVECRNNTKVTESAHAVITGKGNYTGEIIKDFRIYTLKDVSELNISILKDGEYEYNGTALIPQIAVVDEERRVELEEGIDYTVKASKNINAGQAVAEIKGIGTYRGSVKKNFTINPMPIASSEVNLVMSNQKVTSLNTAPKQNLALSMMVDGKVKNLKLGVDYVIDKWSDSTSTMKNAQLLLKGKGNFSGERQVTYDIFKVDISKRVTISRVAAHTYTGTQICPEITVACGNHILNKDEEYHVTYGENTKVGLGTITVTAMGETYGGSKTMTFPILPKWLSWIVDKDDPVTVP
ncbi:MAG: hypothetical protein GX567_11770, partial [Clostridia bacterium]|nr:hypothetical protein [Clostridia bacterium]